MTDTKPSDFFSNSLSVAQAALGALGVVAIVFGILMLTVPKPLAVIVTALIAVYVLITGIVYAVLGIFGKDMDGWARAGYIIFGILAVIASIVAFSNLAETAAWFAVFLGIMVGTLWIIEGVASLVSLKEVESKVWAVIFAIISIVAGFTLILMPLWGTVVLWMFTGITLIVMGVVQLVRAITLKKKVDNFFAI